jgi:predicted nucleotidyltransferase
MDLMQTVITSVKSKFTDFNGFYFFGSRAENRNSPDSDYDLLLLFGHKPSWQEKNIVYDILAQIEISEQVVLDAQIYSEEDFKEKWTPFRQNVMEKGIFYGAK